MASAKERYEPWNTGATYVIGHRHPDTDAIASALGYAWYLTATGLEGTTAARAGQPSAQATFALKHFGQDAPRLLSGVAPTFGHVAKTQKSVPPDAPLSAAMALFAHGDRVVPIVSAEGFPVGVVTPLALARAYSRPVGNPGGLAQSSQDLVETPPSFFIQDHLSDHRNTLLRSDADDFLVKDAAGKYVGIATRRRILEPPRARLFLVDHNELSQAVEGAEEAEIVGVLDHHRLGNAQTATPIPFVVEPVGSTSTLVAEQCRQQQLEPPAGLAGLLLSGILSDTLVFRSPTTTQRDRSAAAWLAGFGKIDVQSYGAELLHASPNLIDIDAEKIVDMDRKSYQMGGFAVSIGQVEVTGLQELPDRREELLNILEQRRERENLALIGLMVTDVVAGHSHLLCQGDRQILAAFPFRQTAEHEFDLDDMVSRKKQLVPFLYSILEEVS
jgi:manganese-dependent inorganic pyrophosphatase